MSAKRRTFKIRYDSPTVLTFALVCLISLVLDSLTDGWVNRNLCSVYRSSFSDALTYVRLFLHVAGHADASHFFGNICLLLVLGPVTESRYGSKNLLVSIVITALVSGVVHFFLFPGTALLGASGIVFMMIFLSSISGIRRGSIPLSLILVSAVYLWREVYDMLFVSDNVSQITHIIGGLCGIACGVIMARKRK